MTVFGRSEEIWVIKMTPSEYEVLLRPIELKGLIARASAMHPEINEFMSWAVSANMDGGICALKKAAVAVLRSLEPAHPVDEAFLEALIVPECLAATAPLPKPAEKEFPAAAA